MLKINDKKISPLKAKPMRNPGQSLDEEIHRIISEDGTTYAAAIVFPVTLAAL
jgi:hypothetical protein